MEADILLHRNTTEFITAITKNTCKHNVETPALMQPTLMHNKLHFLHVAHACPFDRQSSHSTFNVTETLYIQVTQNPHLCMETTSPYKGHTSHPSFS